MHTLCLVTDYAVLSHKPQLPGELLIHLKELKNPLEMLHAALKYCGAKRYPCIDICAAPDSHLELSEFFQINHVHQLHVDCTFGRGTRVSCNQDIPSCPSLRQLSLTWLRKGDDVLSALRKAIQDCRLPNLNYLSFNHCSFNTEGILPYLFGSRTPRSGTSQSLGHKNQQKRPSVYK